MEKKLQPKLRFKEFSGDWEEKKVDNLVKNKILSKPLDGNHGAIHPTSKDFKKDGIPFIMASDVYNGEIDLCNCKKISKEQADELQKGFSLEGDVLLTHKGTVGNTSIVANITTPYIMLTPQVTYYRVLDKTKLSNLFLKTYFDSFKFQKLLKVLSSGGTRAYIGITKQNHLPIYITSIAEQEKIASFLSSVDNKIDKLEEKKKLLEEYKKGLMKKIFSQEIRFKNDDDQSFPNWEVKKLGEVCIMTSSKRVYLSDYVEKGVPFYRGKEISELKANKTPTDILYITEERYKDYKTKYGAPSKNDILITAVGTLGNIYRIKDDNEFYFKDGNLIWLKKVTENSKFIEILIHWNKKELIKTSIGSTQKALTMVELRKIKLSFPCLKEQEKIADFLSTIDKKIELVNIKIDEMKKFKKGLLQQMFV